MSLADNQAGKTPEESLDPSEASRPAKRARIAVACTRCKSRKQKCDGGQPKCGNCKNMPTCEYIVPSKTIPYGKYQYIKALEARVLELEKTVAAANLQDSGKDNWENVIPSEASLDQNTSKSPSPVLKHREEGKIMEATQYLLDLSLHAGGAFVGAESSNITVGHMLGSIAHTDRPTTWEERPDLGPGSSRLGTGKEPDTLANIPPLLADTLLKGYLKHISTRWVVLYRPDVSRLHFKNLEATLTDPYEVSTLNLVYATAGRFLETVGEVGMTYPDKFYQAALSHFDSILKAHDLKSAQTLLLHAIYCLRAPRGLGAWTNVGLAVRICISLGLHRRIPNQKATLAMEIRKRVFWSCYCLDRQVSVMLGRPFAVSDRDIDVELPLDISDESSDSTIQSLLNPDADHQASPRTSLSCFIHIIRLRRIESDIQQSVYRVDKQKPLSRSKIDGFLLNLSEWRQRIPVGFSESDTETYSYDGVYYYEVYYYQAIRLLLYPQISKPDVHPSLIVKCADACGGVCRTYKSLHRETSVGFSLMAIYSIFLAGLNLLYCLWLSPTHIYNLSTTNDLNACSIVLYIVAERWPLATRYRDAFETIKSNILGLFEDGNTGERIPLPGLDNQGELKDLGTEGLHPEGQREYSAMISDMCGASHFQQQQQPQQPQQPQQQIQFMRPSRSQSMSSVSEAQSTRLNPNPQQGQRQQQQQIQFMPTHRSHSMSSPSEGQGPHLNPIPQTMQQSISPSGTFSRPLYPIPPTQQQQPQQQQQQQQYVSPLIQRNAYEFPPPRQTYNPINYEEPGSTNVPSTAYTFLMPTTSGGRTINLNMPAATLGLPEDFDLAQFLESNSGGDGMSGGQEDPM